MARKRNDDGKAKHEGKAKRTERFKQSAKEKNKGRNSKHHHDANMIEPKAQTDGRGQGISSTNATATPSANMPMPPFRQGPAGKRVRRFLKRLERLGSLETRQRVVARGANDLDEDELKEVFRIADTAVKAQSEVHKATANVAEELAEAVFDGWDGSQPVPPVPDMQWPVEECHVFRASEAAGVHATTNMPVFWSAAVSYHPHSVEFFISDAENNRHGIFDVIWPHVSLGGETDSHDNINKHLNSLRTGMKNRFRLYNAARAVHYARQMVVLSRSRDGQAPYSTTGQYVFADFAVFLRHFAPLAVSWEQRIGPFPLFNQAMAVYVGR